MKRALGGVAQRSTVVSCQYKPRSGLARRARSTTAKSARPSFVFDIDGVFVKSSASVLTSPRLKRGKTPIAAGVEALKLLKRKDVPFLLCTNGGGVPDDVRARSLSKLLDAEIAVDNLCQSHTAYRQLAQRYADKPILAMGGRGTSARSVAKSLGFRKVVLPQDILRSEPGIYPWTEAREDDTEACDIASLRFAAAFVLHDPFDDMLRDTQILLDVLLSTAGNITKPRDTDDASVWTADHQVPLFCTNADLLWQANYPEPRLGQGAFHEVIKAIYRRVTGHDLNLQVGGKPSSLTFDYLKGMLRSLTGNQELGQITMIGDNPASDIAGGNAAGWQTALVKTGVYRPPHRPAHQPSVIVEDALEAVQWALEQDGLTA